MPSFPSTLGGAVNGVQKAVVDFFLPPQCPVCRAMVVETGQFCAKCWSDLDIVQGPVCDKLGIPFAAPAPIGTISPKAVTAAPVFDRARSAVLYNDAAKSLVHGLKYRDRHDLAGPMARLMVRAGAELLADADVIVPVPLHWRRLWSRRYNQSGLLAEKIVVQAATRFIPDCVERVRATPQQVGKTSEQRRRNVAGAFMVSSKHESSVRNRRILLVDDVLTTGATANAASRAIKKVGAARVDVLVFAQVADVIEAAI